MAGDFEQWKEQCFVEESASQAAKESPVEMSATETVLLNIFVYGSLLILYGCYAGFCLWLVSGFHEVMVQMQAGTADAKVLRGYGRLLEFLTKQFGVWPSSAIIFGAMQIPVGLMCWQVWRPKTDEDQSEHLPASTPWFPRLEDHTAKKILIVLLVLFHTAVAAILFELLPVGVCAFVMAATVLLAVAVHVQRGKLSSIYED